MSEYLVMDCKAKIYHPLEIFISGRSVLYMEKNTVFLKKLLENLVRKEKHRIFASLSKGEDDGDYSSVG